MSYTNFLLIKYSIKRKIINIRQRFWSIGTKPKGHWHKELRHSPDQHSDGFAHDEFKLLTMQKNGFHEKFVEFVSHGLSVDEKKASQNRIR